MNILLTGGSGFIGRNIREAMSSRYHILAPTHRELELLDEEAVRRFFQKHDIDVVIHAAVRPGHRNAQDPTRICYCNTRMFFNLVRNARHYGKMIFLSSGAVYDERHYRPKMKEEYFDVHVPADEHGFSKYVCARHIELLDNVCELRLFGVFGRYEDYAIRFISNAICKALLGLPITIKQNRRFDYLYVEDLMPVLDHFIKHHPRHRAYNVTPDEAIELYQLAEKVRAVSGKDLPILVGVPGMGPEYSGDNARLREEIPGLEFTPVEEAIRRLYGWYAENLAKIDKQCLLFDK
ncbi:MAG: NAD(P)-dependent oxidoreductase [Syntrophomonadaceae bacterium]|nr:NAD(P)-dependent oxidoreductase [Syntrophomonadaceae bacterium]